MDSRTEKTNGSPAARAAGKPISGARELAEWAAEQALKAAEFREVKVGTCTDMAQVAVLPAGLQVVNLKPYVPEVPDRKVGDTQLLTVGSFCRLVNEQKEPESRCFGNLTVEPYTIVCRVDWHGQTGKPAGWEEYTISLQLRASKEFKAWAAINGKMMRQGEFAEFLKDNRLDITDPNGAEVLTLVQNLETTSERRCAGKLPTNNGTSIRFEEDTRTSVNGSTVTVPDRLELRLPLFDGGTPIPMDADFRLRVHEGNLTFGVRLIGIDRTIRAALLAVAEQVERETSLAVYI